MSRRLFLAAMVAVSAAAAPATLPAAQDAPQLSATAGAARHPGDVRSADAAMPRMLHTTLREYGFNPERLTRTERRALESAFAELFPRSGSLARAQLNRAQSVALVYVALVEPSRDRGWSGRDRLRCGEADERVYTLTRVLGDTQNGHRLFLSRQEQEQLRRGAREIQRAAANCGDYRLADRATQLLELLDTNLAERSRVGDQLTRMRRALQESDGRR